MRKLAYRLIPVLLWLPGAAFAQFCPPQYQETMVQPAFETANQTLEQSLNAVDQALSSQLEFNTQRQLSALAVLTKQKAVAANQIAETTRMSNQQTANAVKTLSQTKRVKDARVSFGGEFGQGYSPCVVYAERSRIANRDAVMATETKNRMLAEVAAAPGVYSDKPVEAQKALLVNRTKFCTQDQVSSGMCSTIGTLPGADLTVSTLFEPAMEGEDLYAAKVAFVNNIIGVPDGAVPASAAKSPDAAAYALNKAKKDALLSPAIASFKEIQLDYSGVAAGVGNQTDLPMAVHFDNQVKRYSGNTPEYDNWARVLSAQDNRGMMVELLKMKALALAQQEKEYRQYERMEANLAALVSMEVQSSGLTMQSNNSGDRAAQKAAGSQIK